MLSLLMAGVLYVDIGLAAHNKDDDLYFWPNNERFIPKWRNGLGKLEIGYTYKRLSGYLLHTSSMQQPDIGLNEIGIKGRAVDSLFYLDFMLSRHSGDDDIYQWKPVVLLGKPAFQMSKWGETLGAAEVGFSFDKFSVYYLYKQPLESNSVPLREYGIKARVFEW